MASGELDVAEHAARHLHRAFPTLGFARTLCAIFDRMPPAEEGQSTFKSDATKDVQVIARNSEVVALVFCGKGGALGIPLPVVYPWLARLPASLVFLRDFRRLYFLQGVQSLGPTIHATLTGLRRIITSLHGRRIVCYGHCAGVFAALRYGLELGADALLCTAGPTNLTPEFNARTPFETRARALKSQVPDACLDMREMYSSAANPPRVCIVYGKDFRDDCIQAEHMSTLSCVTLYGIDDCALHTSLTTEVILRGEFEGLLNWLVRPQEENSPTTCALTQSRSGQL
jgi:hypothetical protein